MVRPPRLDLFRHQHHRTRRNVEASHQRMIQFPRCRLLLQNSRIALKKCNITIATSFCRGLQEVWPINLPLNL